MSWFYEALSRAEKKRAESTNQNGIARRASISTRFMAVALALTVAVTAFLMGYYWRGTRSNLGGGPPETVAAAPSRLQAAWQPGLPYQPPPSAYTPPEARNSIDGPGFILQVAAMKDEAKAGEIFKALREADLPVFVFTVASDPLYRVAVGPFPGRPPRTVRDQLHAKGFEPFSRSWPVSGSSRVPWNRTRTRLPE